METVTRTFTVEEQIKLEKACEAMARARSDVYFTGGRVEAQQYRDLAWKVRMGDDRQ